MNIRVFTDLRFTTSATPTGVGKHIFHLARGLSAVPGCRVSLLAASDQAANPGILSFLPVARLPLPWKIASVFWTLTCHPHADRWCSEADWVYCPKNDWIPLRSKRLAVTIHGAHELDPDMPRSAHPFWWLYRLRNRVQYRKMCGRANVIFTVSEFLKRQICDWFSADPAKVVVVGNGVDPVYFAAGKAESPGGLSSVESAVAKKSGFLLRDRLPSSVLRPASSTVPYILCVGGLNFLDGGDRVIALGREIQRQRLNLRVQVAGCQHESGMPQQAARTSVIDLLGYVQAESLSTLMRDAVALYYPTRYETFGMAAAEAMAAGVPVITCRSTAVPEIVGKAGFYIEADKPEQAMEAIQRVMSDPQLRMQHVAWGRQRAAGYTWDACARRVYRELELRMQEGR